MIKNGLVGKYYLENKVGNHGVVFDIKERRYDFWALRIKDDSRFGSGRYFFKSCDNYQVGAEVLLSQVYSKLFGYQGKGQPSDTTFKTAIYLPATLREESGKEFYGVISDDILNKVTKISKPNVCSESFYDKDPMNFYYEKRQQSARCGVSDNGYFYGDFVLYNTLHGDKSKITEHFSPEAARQMILMRAESVATFDEDRHTSNMALNIDKHKTVGGVCLFDYSWSGDAYGEHITSIKEKPNSRITKDCVDLYGHTRTYFNEFCPFKSGSVLTVNQKTRSEMAYNFKNNESVKEYISPSELVDKIVSVDIKGIAKDIENTIGYKVNEEYVKTLEESTLKFAEEVQGA